MQIAIEFIDEQNKEKYKQVVLNWIKADYVAHHKPRKHFWSNRSTIAEAFDTGNIAVALNDKNRFIGYMMWIIHDHFRGEIKFVEVKKEYRRAGVFKRMLSEFVNRYRELFILSLSPLNDKAEQIFIKAGWKAVQGSHGQYIKIIRPGLPLLDELPDGRALAICSEDFYKVKADPNKYKPMMKFMQIEVNENGELTHHIIADFHHEGYIGIYFNKQLIRENKAKHLFKNKVCDSVLDLLIIGKMEVQEPDLFDQIGFFPQSRPQKKQKIELKKPSFFPSENTGTNNENNQSVNAEVDNENNQCSNN